MKYISYFAILSFFFISCESKTPIEIKQIESQEMVQIIPSSLKDSVIIAIPTEFEIKISPSVRYITWHYVGDGKTLWKDAFDYQICETSPLNQLDIYEIFAQKRVRIIKKERQHLIAIKEAVSLLKKYNKSIEKLKLGETIKLNSYDKFKIENKALINDFRKINDSIKFRVMKGDGSFFYLRQKIDW
ncbi:hypothetical protein C8C83_3990 [Flavobacterium sp. 90]|uniref:hypothetical protein n=1 Tax=unclassified Flavobacterium TaxID=196869 RepID=UPI000EAB5F9E|nr:MULTISPECIES: hypothetical protein [unclassified Flavobacterium]RKR04658.1 hypothetical protein C8C82_4321 [Flavobacterium sp. 81]TCK55982.1 hypothetical protein C8C83_3990 [Flavobacterium sp. 90]